MRMHVTFCEQQPAYLPVCLCDVTEDLGAALTDATVVADYDLLVHKPSINGTELQGEMTATVTPEGTVSAPVFEGTPARITVRGAPVGMVSVPEIEVELDTKPVQGIDSVGTLPSCSLPELEFSVEGEALRIGWSAGSFAPGTLPTKAAAVAAATGVRATASQPVFTGIMSTASGNYTPEGTVSAPVFTGNETQIEVTPDE